MTKIGNKDVSLLVSSISNWFESVIIIEFEDKKLLDITYEKQSNIITLLQEFDLLLIPFIYKNISNERIKILDLFFKNSEVKLNIFLEILGTHINKVTGWDYEDYRLVLLDDETINDILDDETSSFFKILITVSLMFNSLRLKYNDNTEPKINTKNTSLKWHGTQTEFMELSKALIESNVLRGKQKDIINNLSIMFDFKVNAPDKVIQDIKNRNIGSETLFLDKLKTSLLDYIKK